MKAHCRMGPSWIAFRFKRFIGSIKMKSRMRFYQTELVRLLITRLPIQECAIDTLWLVEHS